MVTGDDSNPFSSDGYAPIDDARRAATRSSTRSARPANTNDLRGKLLRIKVSADGTYTIPAGNLFAPGTMGTKPEIYAMGFRNPFRFAVDRSHRLGLPRRVRPRRRRRQREPRPRRPGRVQPDQAARQLRLALLHGQERRVQRLRLRHQHGRRRSSTAPRPKNTSPNNTGLIDLPPAVPAWIAYDGGSIPEFGSGSESPMGGPTYHYDADQPVHDEVPRLLRRQELRLRVRARVDQDVHRRRRRQLPAVETYFGNFGFKQLIDLQFGPDGALYVLDYGSGGFFQGDENSAVYRIDYVSGAAQPGRDGQGRQDVRPGPAGGAVLLRGLGRPRRRRRSPTRGTSTTTARSTRPPPARRTPTPPAATPPR